MKISFPKIPIGNQIKFNIENDKIDRNRVDDNILLVFLNWLNAPISEGENGLISRNDGLLNILHHAAGLTGQRRNLHDMSTILTTRVDRSDSYGNVPLVLTKEKDGDNINEGINDLIRKFQWIPHYENIPFIFGIAISKSDIVFGKLTSSREFVQINRESLRSDQSKLKCVYIAIQIATVINHYINGNLFASCELPINQWIDRNDGKRIQLRLNYVENQFANFDTYMFLKKMYQDTIQIPLFYHLHIKKNHLMIVIK